MPGRIRASAGHEDGARQRVHAHERLVPFGVNERDPPLVEQDERGRIRRPEQLGAAAGARAHERADLEVLALVVEREREIVARAWTPHPHRIGVALHGGGARRRRARDHGLHRLLRERERAGPALRVPEAARAGAEHRDEDQRAESGGHDGMRGLLEK